MSVMGKGNRPKGISVLEQIHPRATPDTVGSMDGLRPHCAFAALLYYSI